MSSNGGRHIHHLRAAGEANGNFPRAGASTAVRIPASTGVSQAIVDLISTRTGTTPATATTEISSNLVVVALSEVLTIPEKTLAAKGHSALTIQVRNSLYQGMRADAVAAVEEITGRRVAAYLTDQQHDPDLAVIAFVLERPAGEGSE